MRKEVVVVGIFIGFLSLVLQLFLLRPYYGVIVLSIAPLIYTRILYQDDFESTMNKVFLSTSVAQLLILGVFKLFYDFFSVFILKILAETALTVKLTSISVLRPLLLTLTVYTVSKVVMDEKLRSKLGQIE